MKKLLSFSLAAVLFLSTFSIVTVYMPSQSDNSLVIAKSKSKPKYKLVKGRLLHNNKNNRPVFGEVVFNKKIYYYSRPFTGVKNNIQYVNGIKHTGVYGLFNYKNGKKGTIDVKQYPYDKDIIVPKSDKILAAQLQNYINKYTNKVTKKNYKTVLIEAKAHKESISKLVNCEASNKLYRDISNIYSQAYVIENPIKETDDEMF